MVMAKKLIKAFNKTVSGSNLINNNPHGGVALTDPFKKEEGGKIDDEESDDDKETETPKSGRRCGADVLFNLRTQVHVWHLNTDSLGVHLALDEFYKTLIKKADNYLETYQGAYGVKIESFAERPTECYAEVDRIKARLNEFIDWCKEERKNVDDNTDLENLIDEMIGLTHHTLYLLRLK
jgi:hypothetical protein